MNDLIIKVLTEYSQAVVIATALDCLESFLYYLSEDEYFGNSIYIEFKNKKGFEIVIYIIL